MQVERRRAAKPTERPFRASVAIPRRGAANVPLTLLQRGRTAAGMDSMTKTTTKGHKYAQSNDTAIVRELIALVTRDAGRIANHYVDAYLDRHEGEDDLPTRQRLHRAIERLARDNQLRTESVKGRTATLTNYHPITYSLGGKAVSIRDMVSHRANVHGLAYEAIRQRLHKGMTPAEALSAPKTTRGKLNPSVRQREDDDPGW